MKFMRKPKDAESRQGKNIYIVKIFSVVLLKIVVQQIAVQVVSHFGHFIRTKALPL